MSDNTKHAKAAPRCQYIRLNDQPCTQPALKGTVFCRFHDLVDHPLPTPVIPFVEDGTSLQVALMQVIRSLQLGKITRPVAGTILYALQIAAQNLKHFSEEAGHPFAQPNPRKTRKEEQEEEALAGPSLAEIFLERLQLVDPQDAPDQKLMRQASALAHPPAVHHDAAPQTPLCSSVSSVVKKDVKPEPGIIDKLEACADLRSHQEMLRLASPLPDAVSCATFSWRMAHAKNRRNPALADHVAGGSANRSEEIGTRGQEGAGC